MRRRRARRQQEEAKRRGTVTEGLAGAVRRLLSKQRRASWLPAALMAIAFPKRALVPGTERKVSQRSWFVLLSSGTVHGSITPFTCAPAAAAENERG